MLPLNSTVQLNLGLQQQHSVPNSNSSPSSSSQSQADDSQSEREEQQVDQFYTDESTPCQSPTQFRRKQQIDLNNNDNNDNNNSDNIDHNNRINQEINDNIADTTSNGESSMTKLPIARVNNNYHFERVSLRRSSQRRPIKRNSQRRRSRRARQVRFEPVAQAIGFAADSSPNSSTTSNCDEQHTNTLRNNNNTQPNKNHQFSQQHGIFETSARKRVQELTKSLNKLGNRVNFRKLKLKRFNVIAANLQEKLSQSKSVLKQSHRKFQTKALARRNLHNQTNTNTSQINNSTPNSSPKAASYDLHCDRASAFSESQFEPIQSGRYGLVCEDQADSEFKQYYDGAISQQNEDWGSDFDQSEQSSSSSSSSTSTAESDLESDSENNSQGQSKGLKQNEQLDKPTNNKLATELSLRQLVIDVIDNCEKPGKLSTLTRSVLNRSNSLCSNLSSSHDELQSEKFDNSVGKNDVKHGDHCITKTRTLTTVGHHTHHHHDLTVNNPLYTHNLTKNFVPNKEAPTIQLPNKSLYTPQQSRNDIDNIENENTFTSSIQTHNTNSTFVERSMSSVNTIDGLEHRSINQNSISFEPNQELGADSTTASSQRQNHPMNHAKIALKKYFTQGWRDFSKLGGGFARLKSKFSQTTSSPTNEMDGSECGSSNSAPINNQQHNSQQLESIRSCIINNDNCDINNNKQMANDLIANHVQNSHHLGGSPQANSVAFARSDAGLANHFVTLSNRKWKSCHLRGNIMHIALNGNNNNNYNNININNNISNVDKTSPFSSGRDLAYLDNSRNFTDDDI